MHDLSQFNRTRDSLTINSAALHYLKALPGWLQDRFLGLQSFSNRQSGWEIAEALLSEAILNPNEDESTYFLSCLVTSFSDEAKPLVVDFNAGEFTRPNVPGQMVFGGNGTPGKLQGIGPYHSVKFTIRRNDLLLRMEQQQEGRGLRSLELLHSKSFQDAGLEILLKRLMEECRTNPNGLSMTTDNIVDGIAGRLLALAKPKNKPREPGPVHIPGIERAIEYMHANFTSDITLQELGDVAGLTRCYVSRQFTRAVGVSPKQYLLQLRIEYSKELLRGRHSVYEIAAMTGFSHASHFGLEFKKQVGVAPDVYRKHR